MTKPLPPVSVPGPLAAVKFAYVIPHRRFYYQVNGTWDMSAPQDEHGIIEYLAHRAGPTSYPAMQQMIMRNKAYPRVMGVDMLPNQPHVADLNGDRYLNLWVPPTDCPAPAPFPRISAVLDWLTDHDPDGVAWLTHWMAAKVQRPDLLPLTAVLFSGEQGAGKNTVFTILSRMLGEPNCTAISRKNIENKFNLRWAGAKLLVFGDEITSKEKMKDITNDLKLLITNPELEIEGKGKDQITRRNRMALILASNDDITPVWLEASDRRFTVFTNHDPVTPAHRAMLQSCFDNNVPTPDFVTEICGFWDYLLKLKVETKRIDKPYDNPSRRNLIAASETWHRVFMEDVERRGFRAIEAEHEGEVFATIPKAPEGFTHKRRVHAIYRAYTKALGGRHLGFTKFCTGVLNHRPRWEVSPDGLAWKVPLEPKPQ